MRPCTTLACGSSSPTSERGGGPSRSLTVAVLIARATNPSRERKRPVRSARVFASWRLRVQSLLSCVRLWL